MASRERKRAERRKRKERAAGRRADAPANGKPQQAATTREAVSARSEAKAQAARDALEPLEEHERPTVVTVGAVISALIALSTVVGYAAGVEVAVFSDEGIKQGEEPAPIAAVLATSLLMGVMAWGLWKARYWAVLGFQALLVLVLVATSLGLVQATEWTQAIGNVVVIVVAGALFYLMIKAMARIQMPERLPRE